MRDPPPDQIPAAVTFLLSLSFLSFSPATESRRSPSQFRPPPAPRHAPYKTRGLLAHFLLNAPTPEPSHRCNCSPEPEAAAAPLPPYRTTPTPSLPPEVTYELALLAYTSPTTSSSSRAIGASPASTTERRRRSRACLAHLHRPRATPRPYTSPPSSPASNGADPDAGDPPETLPRRPRRLGHRRTSPESAAPPL